MEAMRIDGAEVTDHAATTSALHLVTAPTTFLRAERGLLDGAPFYPEDTANAWVHSGPVVQARTVWDTNHYSLILGDRGAAAVAEAVTDAAFSAGG